MGDHKVTVPFWWPTCNIAFRGFWVRETGVPCFVAISATIWPVEVSWYFRWPVIPIVERRKW